MTTVINGTGFEVVVLDSILRLQVEGIARSSEYPVVKY